MRILAFAREAGGAAALVPVLQTLRQDADVVVIAREQAVRVFAEADLAPVILERFSASAIADVLRLATGHEQPDVVATSATLPYVDMTEKHLWRWAADRGVPAVAVVDQWQYYGLRFSGPAPAEYVKYVPDWIAVMDDHARRETIAAGVPADRVVVTGQPAFDPLIGLRAAATESDRQAFRARLGVPNDARLICFVAEALSDHFGDQLGYTEHSVLESVLDLCDEIVTTTGPALHVAVKLHPANRPDAFNWVRRRPTAGALSYSFHWTEQPPRPLVLASDIVIGMSSVLLVESILLGRPTMSVQLGARETENCVATVIGAIPLLTSRAAVAATLGGLLNDAAFRQGYLGRQHRLSVPDHATERVIELIRRAAARPAAPAGRMEEA